MRIAPPAVNHRSVAASTCFTFVFCTLLNTFRVNGRRREMYSGHGRLCLSLVAFPHYYTDPDVTWVGVPSSCALLGEFAIGARVSLL